MSKKLLTTLLSILLPVFLVGAVVYATTSVGTNISVEGDLDIIGTDLQATTGTLNISKSGSMTTVRGTLNVDEAVTFDTTLGVTGTTTLTGALVANGNVTLGNATGDTLTVWAPLVWAATTTTYGIDLDAATLSTADIRLSDGATIFNTDANTLTITEATVAISGNETVAGTLGVTGTSTLATTTIGSGTNIAKILFGTITIDPQSINATTSGATSTSVTGAVSGMRCFLEPPAALEDDLVPKGCVTGDGTVTIYLYNADNAAVNGTARDWGYLLIK